MTDVSAFELLNPLIFLFFGAGFLSISRVQASSDRSRRSAFWFSISYFAAMTVFLLEFMRHYFPHPAYTPFTNGLYAVTAICFSIGVSLRAGRKPPYGVLIALGIGVTMTVVAMALMGVPVWIRSLVAHFGNAICFGIGAWAMLSRREGVLEKFIIAFCVVNVVHLLSHPIIIGYYGNWPQTYTDYHASPYLETFQFGIGIIAVVTAMLLLFSYARELIRQFREQASRDKLTGVLNRHGFETQLQLVMRIAQAKQKRVGIIMLDLDHFKAINDGYGHYFGDGVITRFGQLLDAHTKQDGIVGRLGGEEFAYVMPVENLGQLQATASLLRERWERCELSFEGVAVPCTASLGIATLGEHEPLRNALIRADEALYLAKASGRNCVRTQEDVVIAKLKGAAKYMRGDQDIAPASAHTSEV